MASMKIQTMIGKERAAITAAAMTGRETLSAPYPLAPLPS